MSKISDDTKKTIKLIKNKKQNGITEKENAIELYGRLKTQIKKEQENENK